MKRELLFRYERGDGRVPSCEVLVVDGKDTGIFIELPEHPGGRFVVKAPTRQSTDEDDWDIRELGRFTCLATAVMVAEAEYILMQGRHRRAQV